MRFYIIYPPKKTENFFERIHELEDSIIKDGHIVLNPLPVNVETEKPDYDIVDCFLAYAPMIDACEVVCAMDGYAKTDLGNKSMAEAMVQKKIIVFE